MISETLPLYVRDSFASCVPCSDASHGILSLKNLTIGSLKNLAA